MGNFQQGKRRCRACLRRIAPTLVCALLALGPPWIHAGLLERLHERAREHQLLNRGETAVPDEGVNDAAPTAQTSRPAGTRLLREVAYGPDALQRFDVYQGAHPVPGAPLVFMVHGGAWTVGDKANPDVAGTKMAHWLAQGAVFVSVNYRLVPDVTPLQQRDDLILALRAVQRLAPTWGADPGRTLLVGHSAGAHLIALISADPSTAQRAGVKPWRGSILLDSAALDVSRILQTAHHPAFYDQAFGRDPSIWIQASPWHRMQSGLTPMLAVCSSRRAASCEQAKAFAERATQLGNHVTVLPQPLSHKQINSALGEDGPYTTAVDRFLSGLPGWHNPP